MCISTDRSRVLVRIALDFIELVHMYMPNGLGAAVCGSSGQLTRCQSVPTIGIRPSKVNRLSAWQLGWVWTIPQIRREPINAVGDGCRRCAHRDRRHHRMVSGKLWDAQKHPPPGRMSHDSAQGLRCVLKLDVSPITREGSISNSYSVTV